ncbi:MAG TPA: hypothetical protein VFS43_32435 [Polyangiaceae bacterium]|nr:hypothetical protein [Polyangiaceae bacterium]
MTSLTPGVALIALATACSSHEGTPPPLASAPPSPAASAAGAEAAASRAPGEPAAGRGKPDAGGAKAEPGAEGRAKAEPAAGGRATAESAPLPPTTGEWLQPLVDSGGVRVAEFSPPLGATGRRPLVVALHGGGDAPEYACGEWRGSFGSWPFILCPYGTKVGKKMYAWRSGADARRALEHAIEVLAAKYPEHLDLRDPVLTGFSQGAMTAPSALAAPGRAFPAAILVEGYAKDFNAWPKPMEARGLERILFVDSQGLNAERGKAAVRALERSTGVRARSIYIGHLGHGFFPKTVEGVRKGLAELLGGLPGWERYPYPPIEPQ